MKRVRTKNEEGTLALYSHAEMLMRLKLNPNLAQCFFPAYNENQQAKPIGFLFIPKRGAIWYEEVKKGVFEKHRG